MTTEEQRTKAILALKAENETLKAILRKLRDIPMSSHELIEVWKLAEELIKDE